MVSLAQARGAPDGATWKVESMRGFLRKNLVANGNGAFTLTFKKANGTTYVYTVSADGATITAPATTIPVDAEFLMLVMSNWDQVDPGAADSVFSPGTGITW